MAKDGPSQQQVAEALRELVTRPCPICGSGPWTADSKVTTVLPTQDDPDGPVVKHVSTNGHVHLDGTVALPMICQSCGFIAQFKYDLLSKQAKQ